MILSKTNEQLYKMDRVGETLHGALYIITRYNLLLTADCLLLTAYCLLFIAYSGDPFATQQLNN